MTKKHNRQLAKRAIRRAEKGSTLTQDKMMGAVGRRCYGAGGPPSEGKVRVNYDFDVVTDQNDDGDLYGSAFNWGN